MRGTAQPVVFGSPIDDLLERLYAQHLAQGDMVSAYFMGRTAEGSLDWSKFDDRTNEFLSDKFIALGRSKAEFCYQVCRALGARRIVEAGTSYGVSTLFLAAAERDNLHAVAAHHEGGSEPIVIGNEFQRAGNQMMRITRCQRMANIPSTRTGRLAVMSAPRAAQAAA